MVFFCTLAAVRVCCTTCSNRVWITVMLKNPAQIWFLTSTSNVQHKLFFFSFVCQNWFNNVLRCVLWHKRKCLVFTVSMFSPPQDAVSQSGSGGAAGYSSETRLSHHRHLWVSQTFQCVSIYSGIFRGSGGYNHQYWMCCWCSLCND